MTPHHMLHCELKLRPVHTCFRKRQLMGPETGDFVAVFDNKRRQAFKSLMLPKDIHYFDVYSVLQAACNRQLSLALRRRYPSFY